MEKRTIKEWRVKRNITLEMLAKEFGISKTAVCKKIQYPSRMRMYEAVKLAQLFECEVGDIIFLP